MYCQNPFPVGDINTVYPYTWGPKDKPRYYSTKSHSGEPFSLLGFLTECRQRVAYGKVFTYQGWRLAIWAEPSSPSLPLPVFPNPSPRPHVVRSVSYRPGGVKQLDELILRWGSHEPLSPIERKQSTKPAGIIFCKEHSWTADNVSGSELFLYSMWPPFARPPIHPSWILRVPSPLDWFCRAVS